MSRQATGHSGGRRGGFVLKPLASRHTRMPAFFDSESSVPLTLLLQQPASELGIRKLVGRERVSLPTSRHPGDQSPASSRFSTSLRLFVRARVGDLSALSRLFARLLPSLQRWTRRRLPPWARQRMDTGDLVQDAFLKLFQRMGQVEPRRQGALRAYLRESIRNRIRDEVRRAGLVETSQEAGSSFADMGTSPLDCAMASENAERYREALARLDPGDQELIVGRIELGLSYEQLALATERASPAAARVAVRRALLRLAQEVHPV